VREVLAPQLEGDALAWLEEPARPCNEHLFF
jgi:hypothetical protein